LSKIIKPKNGKESTGKGENYSIVIRNNTPERIGVVIAVDGRNIITGEKSFLKNPV
jgi:hypothetical protein